MWHARLKIHDTGRMKVNSQDSIIPLQWWELAVKFKSYPAFICVDDKRYAEVCEPGFPVAVADKGRYITVGLDSSLEVIMILHIFVSYLLSLSYRIYLIRLKYLSIIIAKLCSAWRRVYLNPLSQFVVVLTDAMYIVDKRSTTHRNIVFFILSTH